MNKKTLRNTGLVALALVASGTISWFTPIGQLLQSSLMQSQYSQMDAGLYIGEEKTEGGQKVLRAKQGVSLSSQVLKEGGADYLLVEMKAHNDAADISPDSLRAVLEYDASRLTLDGVSGALASVSSVATLDPEFSQIIKNTAGKETGTLYVGLDAPVSFTKPSDAVVKIKFKPLAGVQTADVSLKMLRLYKRSDLLDTTKPTIYLGRGETQNTTARALTVATDGTSIDASETITTEGKTRTETHRLYDNSVVKTVVTTWNNAGKIVKIVTTKANGDVETKEYVYAADGKYTLTITTKTAGVTSIVVEKYDAASLLISRTKDGLPSAEQALLDAATASGTTLRSSATGTVLTENSTNTPKDGVATAVNTASTTTRTVTGGGTATTTGSACTPSSAERFNDIVGHWSEGVVESARQKCIIGGKSLGRFAPDEAVTRAELTKIAVEAFKVAQSQNGAIGFTDVSDSEWYATYIRAAKLAEIVGGYNDSTFRPNNSINRAEALKIILEAGVKTRGTQIGLNVDGGFSSWMTQNPTYTYVRFPDVKVADWFSKYVLSGFEKGVVSGYNDRGTDVFRPGQAVTRAEAVKMIMSLVE